jgi:hypothetical protein
MQVCKTKEAGSLRALNNMLHAGPSSVPGKNVCREGYAHLPHLILNREHAVCFALIRHY